MNSGSMLSEALEEVKKITSMDALAADENGVVKASTKELSNDEERLLATDRPNNAVINGT